MEMILCLLTGATLALAGLLAATRWLGFGAQAPDDYAAQSPQFDIRRHLDGPILCEGVIYGPTGRVTSRFVADFDVEWTGNEACMRESFRYDSGAVQEREWRLRVGNDGHIRAQAADLVGEGHGTQSGNAVSLAYNIRLPEDAGGHVLAVRDWMYLLSNGSIVNRSQFRKFGIKVAELVAVMRPKDAA